MICPVVVKTSGPRRCRRGRRCGRRGRVEREGFPVGSALAGPRLDLEPLRVEHAKEMAPLLDEPGLHVFTGGEPASLPELR